jgi:UDPglucose 6-dehydrogenase
VHDLPAELAREITLAASAEAAAAGASAIVVATEWPELRRADLAGALRGMPRPLVLDANRFLGEQLAGLGAEYVAVGVPT